MGLLRALRRIEQVPAPGGLPPHRSHPALKGEGLMRTFFAAITGLVVAAVLVAVVILGAPVSEPGTAKENNLVQTDDAP